MKDRDFQRKAYRYLKNGRSVLIVAPTGLGKTRAALSPFTNSTNKDRLLVSRLLYNLPLRALSQSIVDEFGKLSSGERMVIHHGEEPESEIFSEHAVVTTVDQYFTAFAGAPLSWASHKSHAAAGAVLTSYSVFDEVHLLSPRSGLPLLFAILKLRQRWGLPSCVMTATMPQQAIMFLCEHCGLEQVDASPDDVSERDSWREVTLSLLRKQSKTNSPKVKQSRMETKHEWESLDVQALTQLVHRRWESWDSLALSGSRKIIVFMNTVDRAIQIYKNLQNLLGVERVLLAHSRFVKDDRSEVERRLVKRFGRDSEFEGILVTTQVAEAGLNISAPLVISELCPMDSLIQRAGRCMRFKPKSGDVGNGEVVIVKPPELKKDKKDWYRPYEKEPSEETMKVIKEYDGEILCWEKEQDMINKGLGAIFDNYLRGAGGAPANKFANEQEDGEDQDTED